MARSALRTITVAGPSHARRYRVAVATGQIAKTRHPIQWRDLASASILHPYFTEAEFSKQSEPALVFVPDFRIGNRSLVSPDSPDAYTGVDRSLIQRHNDEEMRDRVLARVAEIHTANPEARFVFWSLGWRELNNRTLGNHSRQGFYRHPTWNLADVEAKIGSSVLSLQPMFDHPIRRKLHIDGSGHPSFVGLELFRRMTDFPDVSVAEHLDFLQETLSRPILLLPKETVLTGDSVWMEALRLYVDRGLIRLHPTVTVKTVDELLEESGSQKPAVAFISNIRNLARKRGDTVIGGELSSLLSLVQKGYRVTTYLWEARAIEVIHPAARRPRNHPGSLAALCAAIADELPKGTVISEGQNSPPLVHPTDVEVSHPSGPWPTLHGILGVTRAIGGMHRSEPLC